MGASPGDDQASFVVRTEGNEERIVTPGANRYQLEAEDFVRAIQTGTAPRWTVDDAIGNMAAIDALLRAARTGKMVKVELR